MTILVIGAEGQLGYELMRQGHALDLDIHGVDYPQIDITVTGDVSTHFSNYRPSLVINAAAYTDVDGAESEPERTMEVNRDGVANLACCCAEYSLPLIHISTDYVFDGRKSSPYRESDSISPIGVYGSSKAAGEAALRANLDEHIILRTAWLYGSHGRNFVKTILRSAREKSELRVVSDQYGSPTSAADLAETIYIISDMLNRAEAANWGTYHYCGKGIISWHEFACAIVNLGRKHTKLLTDRVEPIPTSDFPTKVARPPYSALDCSLIEKRFGIFPKPWQKSLEKTIIELFTAGGLSQD